MSQDLATPTDLLLHRRQDALEIESLHQTAHQEIAGKSDPQAIVTPQVDKEGLEQEKYDDARENRK